MTEISKDAGVIQALVERFEKYRLPRILELKEKVDSGGLLDAPDIAYLDELLDDAQRHKSLVDRNPEWQAVSAQVTSLYKQITQKALENEQGTS
jgi:hypothetical protein